MKTYKQIIDTVERELRPVDAFPDAATKLQEQLDVVYRYGVALAKELPLSRLSVEKSAELAAAETYGGLIYEATLPADVSNYRPDLGLYQIEFDGDVGSERKLMGEAVSYEALKAAVDNFYQQQNFMFAIDLNSQVLFYPVEIESSYVHYAKAVPAATSANYTTTQMPMDDNSIDVLIEAVASHFASVNARDVSAGQIHATLSQILKE